MVKPPRWQKRFQPGLTPSMSILTASQQAKIHAVGKA